MNQNEFKLSTSDCKTTCYRNRIYKSLTGRYENYMVRYDDGCNVLLLSNVYVLVSILTNMFVVGTLLITDHVIF